jgi:hypothetical protein
VIASRWKTASFLGVVVFAAMIVSPAMALGANGTFTVSGAEATGYAGNQVAPGHTLTLSGERVISCTTSTLSGTIANGATEFKATPVFAGCSMKIGGSTLPVTINAYSCFWEYLLKGPSGPGWLLWGAIKCIGGGNFIEVKVYANAASHAAGTTLCEFRITEQMAYEIWLVSASPVVAVRSIGALLAYIRNKGTLGNCGPTEANATYNGESVLTPFSGTFAVH